MAFAKQPVTLTNQGGGTFTLAVANETYTFDAAQVVSLYEGRRDLDHLLFQILIVLKAAGVNPRTATFAQVKAAVEAQTYFWGA